MNADARRIDPRTGEPVDSLLRRGRKVPREPSAAPVEHLHYDWFPLRVSPGKERLVRLLLEDRGFVTFCPMEVKWRNANRADRARRKKRQIAYPWHPGLVFVGMQQPHPWHQVVSIPPVRSVISIRPDRPVRMNPDDLWRLMKRFGEGRFVAPESHRWMRTGQEFGPGDMVRVVSGPLEGHIGPVEVQEITGNMARVFATFFGAERGFDIDVQHLARDE